jgi:hypothetical protein
MLTETLKQKLYSAIMATYETNEYIAWNPFTPDRLIPYYYTDLVHRLYSCVKSIEQTGYTPAEILSRLSHVTSLREELHALLAYWGQGDLHISQQELNEVVGFILRLFLTMCKDEPFSERGHLWILSKADIDSLIQRMNWAIGDFETARELGKVVVAATALSSALYTDVWPNAVGDMYHGPYELGQKGLLIVRDYVDLAPSDLWSHTTDWDIKEVRILTCYKPSTDLYIDFEGTLRSKSNLLKCLRYWAIEVNGQPVEAGEIASVYRSLARCVAFQVKVTNALDLEESKKWFLRSHCYLQKELLALAGIDWKPTDAMYSAIAGKPLLPEVENLIESRSRSLKHALDALALP